MSACTPQVVQALALVLGFISLLLAGWGFNRWMVRRIPAPPVLEPTPQPAAPQPDTVPISWVLEELLPALDGFDDAMEAASLSPATEQLVLFIAGLRIVQSQFFKALRRCGIAPLPVVIGDAFNPGLHTAVDVVVSEAVQPGRVAAVLRRGYLLEGGRTVRFASVLVTKRAEPESDSKLVVTGIGLVAALCVLLCGCFESSYVGGWLLAKRSAQTAQQADAGTEQMDGGMDAASSAPGR